MEKLFMALWSSYNERFNIFHFAVVICPFVCFYCEHFVGKGAAYPSELRVLAVENLTWSRGGPLMQNVRKYQSRLVGKNHSSLSYPLLLLPLKCVHYHCCTASMVMTFSWACKNIMCTGTCFFTLVSVLASESHLLVPIPDVTKSIKLTVNSTVLPRFAILEKSE